MNIGRNTLYVLLIVVFYSCKTGYTKETDLFYGGKVFTKIRDKIVVITDQKAYGFYNMMDSMRRRPYLYRNLNTLNKFNAYLYTEKNNFDANNYIYVLFEDNVSVEYKYNFDEDIYTLHEVILKEEFSKEDFSRRYQQVLKDTALVVFKVEVRKRGKKIKVKKVGSGWGN